MGRDTGIQDKEMEDKNMGKEYAAGKKIPAKNWTTPEKEDFPKQN